MNLTLDAWMLFFIFDVLIFLAGMLLHRWTQRVAAEKSTSFMIRKWNGKFGRKVRDRIAEDLEARLRADPSAEFEQGLLRIEKMITDFEDRVGPKKAKDLAQIVKGEVKTEVKAFLDSLEEKIVKETLESLKGKLNNHAAKVIDREAKARQDQAAQVIIAMEEDRASHGIMTAAQEAEQMGYRRTAAILKTLPHMKPVFKEALDAYQRYEEWREEHR